MGKEAGKEVEVDGRGNVFKSSFFTLLVPICLILAVVGIFGLKRFFSGEGFKTKAQKEQAVIDEKKTNVSNNKSLGLVDANKKADTPQVLKTSDDLSPFRVSGYASDGKVVVLFIDVGGRSLLQRAADDNSLISGQYVETNLDGRRIGTYSGFEKKPEPSSGIPR